MEGVTALTANICQQLFAGQAELFLDAKLLPGRLKLISGFRCPSL